MVCRVYYRNYAQVVDLMYFIVIWLVDFMLKRVNLLGLGQSQGYPSASEVTLKNMSKWFAWIPKELITYHCNDVIMGAIASQITSLTIVFSTVYLDTGQRKHQSSTSLAFERGIHRRPVNSQHKWPVTRKMFPFDDVIMLHQNNM